REQGRLDQAIESYREALRLDPNLHHARMHLLHQRMHLCDWAGLDEEIAAIREIVRSVPQAQISPFAFLALPGTTPQEQRLCAEHWARNRYATLVKPAPAPQPPPRDPARLRIGYLSADFRQHPLTWLAAGLIEQHDRAAFEVHGYAYGPDDGSAERRRWESAFDVFHDIRAASLQESAAQVVADGIAILVDLTGFTQSSRSGILALRPAPLQVNWLGFPGSMGAPFVDYLISDGWITPPETAADYSEQLLLMPHTYQPNGARPEADAPTRAGCGLPEAGVVFCCFNQTFKITPQVFEAWMQILAETPGSVLWLLECNRRARENLVAHAARHGIAAERLIFAPRTGIAGHLARQRCADLFLDTS
ncbi:MAG: tetratricopeptide repeat protein, partial [Methylobacterium sp.]|nr:tetratricopeptide repeat protein [Methylobacterium sp.]